MELATRLDQSTMAPASVGRTLPHNIEFEESVIGGVLLKPKAFLQVADVVAVDDFYHPVLGVIFQAMLDTDRANKPIDALTVADQLRASDTMLMLRAFNNEAYLAELMNKVVTTENIVFHARAVRGKAIARRLIEVAQEIAAKGMGEYGDVDEFIDEAERSVFEVAQRSRREDVRRLDQDMALALRRLEKRAKNPGAITGVPSGYPDIDNLTGGFQPGDLIIIAARPSMGKTSLVVSALRNAARAGIPVLIFSAEMSREAVSERLLSGDARIPSERMRSGTFFPGEWAAMTKAASGLAAAPIWMDATSAPSLLSIRSKARRWRASDAFSSPEQHGIIAIDYLQLVEARTVGMRDQNREREIAEISRGLKSLAKDLNLPVIALSQLNRAVESRGDKRPVLSDLRESGAIEQDADVIAFIYRDEVYDEDSDNKGVAEVIIRKQRNGPTDTARLAFLNQYTRFENLQEER